MKFLRPYFIIPSLFIAGGITLLVAKHSDRSPSVIGPSIESERCFLVKRAGDTRITDIYAEQFPNDHCDFSTIIVASEGALENKFVFVFSGKLDQSEDPDVAAFVKKHGDFILSIVEDQYFTHYEKNYLLLTYANASEALQRGIKDAMANNRAAFTIELRCTF